MNNFLFPKGNQVFFSLLDSSGCVSWDYLKEGNCSVLCSCCNTPTTSLYIISVYQIFVYKNGKIIHMLQKAVQMPGFSSICVVLSLMIT